MKIKANDGKTYDIPDILVWHDGPPPELGWWPASVKKGAKHLRYWDGVVWSWDCFPFETENCAAYRAKFKAAFPNREIKWADRWWEVSAK